MGKIALSINEAAQALGISRAKLYQLINTEGFPSVRLGARRMINAKKLQEWLDERTGGTYEQADS